MANKKPLYIENGRIQEYGPGDTISATIAPGSGGGGGGSVSVEQNGVEVVTAASVLNFIGGVTVIDGGSGEAIINISGGGGGGVPTIVQKKGSALANIAAGITMDSAPSSGNVLVAIVFNSTGTGVPSTSSGWTSLDNNTALPDHNILWRIAGVGESAVQVPTSTVDGGVIILYELTNGAAGAANVLSGTFSTANVSFSTNVFFSTSSGVLIALSGRRTDESASFVGSCPTDILVQGGAGVVGGTGVSVVTGLGQLLPAGTPSASSIWPTSAATKIGYVLVA